MPAVGYTGSDSTKVSKTGDTMTGPLTLPGDPTQALHAATRQFVLSAAAAAVAAGGGGGGGGGTPALSPQNLTYAASITINATLVGPFRIVATGPLTIADITGGLNGQEVVVEVEASGADRALAVAGIAGSLTIPSGKVWTGTFRFRSSNDTWYLDDNRATATGAGGGALGPGTVTDAEVAAAAGISLAKTADSTASGGRLALTNAERTQLGGLTAALAGKAAASHTHTVDQLVTTGTRDATTALHGDGVWRVPAGGGGGTPPAGSVTDASVALAAAISLAKTADSADRLAMSAAERAKLAALSTAGQIVAGFVPSGSTTPTVTHSLGTNDLVIVVQDQSTLRYNPPELTQVVSVDTNTVRFTFTAATTTQKYRYIIASKSTLLDAPQVRDLPVPQAYAASLTINAAGGNFRTIDATGNLTLNPPASGEDGQRLLIRVTASIAQRVVTFAPGLRRSADMASTVTIPTGRRCYIGLVYEAADGWFVLAARAA